MTMNSTTTKTLYEIMSENEIPFNSFFTIAEYLGQEGLLFFKPNIEEDEDGNKTAVLLEPIKLLINDAVFIYDKSMDERLYLKHKNGKILLTRIDGFELELTENDLDGFQVKDISEKPKQTPDDIAQTIIKSYINSRMK
jgi:hypothetical protein